MSSKTWLVARREYLETVKTKTFLVSLAMMPLIMGIWILVPTLLIKHSGPVEVEVAVLDLSNRLYPALTEQASRYNARPDARPKIRLTQVRQDRVSAPDVEASLERLVRAKKIFGYLVVPSDAVDGHGAATYGSGNLALNEVPENLGRWLNTAATDARVADQHLDPELIAELRRPVPFERAAVGEKGGKEKRNAAEAILTPMFTSMAFVMLLFLGVTLVGQACLTSIIEEKSNRIIEVVLASTSPSQFMVGKILGMGAMGLTLLAAWGGGGYAAAAWKGYSRFVPLDNLAYLLVYFVLGFLLYASTFCAAGSVCNSTKDAQNLMGPITLVLLLPPIALMAPITRDPSGPLAVAMSYVPFWTPFVMMNRLAGFARPGPLEIALSMAVLAAGTAAVFWAAGRIFRVGALMYGQPPRLRELLRWLGQSG